MAYVLYMEDGRIQQTMENAALTIDAFTNLESTISKDSLYLGAVPDAMVKDRDTTRLYIALLDRPTMEPSVSKTRILANATDQAVIGELPVPCTVFVDGAEIAVTDGSLTISARTPRAVSITVRKWPYFDWSTEIEAVAP